MDIFATLTDFGRYLAFVLGAGCFTIASVFLTGALLDWSRRAKRSARGNLVFATMLIFLGLIFAGAARAEIAPAPFAIGDAHEQVLITADALPRVAAGLLAAGHSAAALCELTGSTYIRPDVCAVKRRSIGCLVQFIIPAMPPQDRFDAEVALHREDAEAICEALPWK